MVTGIDIVREQVRIAAGEELEVAQDAVELRGREPAKLSGSRWTTSTGTPVSLRSVARPDARIGCRCRMTSAQRLPPTSVTSVRVAHRDACSFGHVHRTTVSVGRHRSVPSCAGSDAGCPGRPCTSQASSSTSTRVRSPRRWRRPVRASSTGRFPGPTITSTATGAPSRPSRSRRLSCNCRDWTRY